MDEDRAGSKDSADTDYTGISVSPESDSNSYLYECLHENKEQTQNTVSWQDNKKGLDAALYVQYMDQNIVKTLVR